MPPRRSTPDNSQSFLKSHPRAALLAGAAIATGSLAAGIGVLDGGGEQDHSAPLTPIGVEQPTNSSSDNKLSTSSGGVDSVHTEPIRVAVPLVLDAPFVKSEREMPERAPRGTAVPTPKAKVPKSALELPTPTEAQIPLEELRVSSEMEKFLDNQILGLQGCSGSKILNANGELVAVEFAKHCLMSDGKLYTRTGSDGKEYIIDSHVWVYGDGNSLYDLNPMGSSARVLLSSDGLDDSAIALMGDATPEEVIALERASSLSAEEVEKLPQDPSAVVIISGYPRNQYNPDGSVKRVDLIGYPRVVAEPYFSDGVMRKVLWVEVMADPETDLFAGGGISGGGAYTLVEQADGSMKPVNIGSVTGATDPIEGRQFIAITFDPKITPNDEYTIVYSEYEIPGNTGTPVEPQIGDPLIIGPDGKLIEPGVGAQEVMSVASSNTATQAELIGQAVIRGTDGTVLNKPEPEADESAVNREERRATRRANRKARREEAINSEADKLIEAASSSTEPQDQSAEDVDQGEVVGEVTLADGSVANIVMPPATDVNPNQATAETNEAGVLDTAATQPTSQNGVIQPTPQVDNTAAEASAEGTHDAAA